MTYICLSLISKHDVLKNIAADGRMCLYVFTKPMITLITIMYSHFNIFNMILNHNVD